MATVVATWVVASVVVAAAVVALAVVGAATVAAAVVAAWGALVLVELLPQAARLRVSNVTTANPCNFKINLEGFTVLFLP